MTDGEMEKAARSQAVARQVALCQEKAKTDATAELEQIREQYYVPDQADFEALLAAQKQVNEITERMLLRRHQASFKFAGTRDTFGVILHLHENVGGRSRALS